MKANEHAIVAGSIIYSGLIWILIDRSASMGIRILQMATFDVTCVSAAVKNRSMANIRVGSSVPKNCKFSTIISFSPDSCNLK
jgi:hypothetical protein